MAFQPGREGDDSVAGNSGGLTREDGDDISTSTFITKSDVVASLRSRDLNDRADWVDRTMPAFIDTSLNASILDKLGIDIATMSTYDRPEARAVASDDES